MPKPPTKFNTMCSIEEEQGNQNGKQIDMAIQYVRLQQMTIKLAEWLLLVSMHGFRKI